MRAKSCGLKMREVCPEVHRPPSLERTGKLHRHALRQGGRRLRRRSPGPTPSPDKALPGFVGELHRPGPQEPVPRGSFLGRGIC